MASVFKRSKKKNTPYSIQYFDHEGKRRTVKGFTDKGLTEQLAAKLEGEARMRLTGLVDPEQERYWAHKSAPLKGHLEAFEKSLRDNTSKHLTLTMTRVNRIVAGCDFQKLADVDREVVQSFLQGLQDKENLGHRTYNHYLQAMDSFLNWCVETKRLLTNPLAGLDRLNTEVDIRHKRRALTEEEFGKLVLSARQSKESIQCYNGEQRSRIYVLSYMTGLRRNELASLMPRSFDLDADPPTVTVEAKYSKHRRKDVLPLHPELVAFLREWVDRLKPTDPLFPKLANRRTWLMVKKDLERVGIPYENQDGIADFHAAGRHTHITELLRNGATLPEAQKLARHTDVKMTMRYAHIGIKDQADAVAKLPANALHWRCSLGGADSHSLSSDGTTEEAKKCENPCNDRGFGGDCHPMASVDKMEAAGIEPASRDGLAPASTCIARSSLTQGRPLARTSLRRILGRWAPNGRIPSATAHPAFNRCNGEPFATASLLNCPSCRLASLPARWGCL